MRTEIQPKSKGILAPLGLASFVLLSIGFSSNTLAAEFECISPVQSVSNPEQMLAKNFSANIKWKDVKLSPTSVGYGPAEDHKYELTIVDGKVYMARPEGTDKVIIRNDPKPEEGATMLQVGTPKAWGKSETLPAVSTFDELSFEIDNVIEDLDCGDDALIPFKITGHAKEVTWSMDTEKPRIVTSKNQDVTIVGIYNTNDRRKYFMMRGYNIHAHIVMHPLDQAGHLRSAVLDEGAQVWLPVKNNS